LTISELGDQSLPGLVHFHHGAFTPSVNGSFGELVATSMRPGHAPPALITKNVFAVRDRILDEWPGRRLVGLPGRWASAQYHLAAWPVRVPTAVVPNVQDAAFFREPTVRERDAARAKWNRGAGRLVVRVGSPIADKWSGAYLPLARRIAREDADALVLVGPPPEIAASVGALGRVNVVDHISDDDVLRELYWAADVVALDARRGETFGNVIVESLLCGTPVVYRARPFRDNTPWELRGLSGFIYAEDDRAWLASVLTHQTPPDDRTRETVVAMYGWDAVRSLYIEIAHRASGCESSVPEFRSASAAIGWRNTSMSMLRHNAMAAFIKARRNAAR